MSRSDELFPRGTLKDELEDIRFSTHLADGVIRKMRQKVPFLEREIRIPVPVAALALVLTIGLVLFPTFSDPSPHHAAQQVVVTDSGVFDQKWLARRTP